MPHSTLDSHLRAEAQILRALHQRAKHQHRAQGFLAKMLQVHRLVWRLASDLGHPESVPSVQIQRIVFQVGPPPPFESLIFQLQKAVTSASLLSYQIVQLRHFLPLHTVLLGIYARLATLAGHIAQSHTVDSTPCQMDVSAVHIPGLALRNPLSTDDPAIGQKVNLGGIGDLAKSEAARSAEPQTLQSQLSTADAPSRKKRRKADAIDDLFATVSKTTQMNNHN